MTDFWLQGPVDGVPAALQPAAHALLQTAEDITGAVESLTREQVWARPGGVASIGFHLIHLAGATDRLYTAARGGKLSDEQKAALAAERTPPDPPPDLAALLETAVGALRRAVDQLRSTDAGTLQDTRTVGRAALPTTVGGLLFHGAEHAQRHAGQIVTTAKIVRIL
jgi:uncharacterized damage-inducible protein DinB